MMERAFEGFAAIPAPGKRPWRSVLGVKAGDTVQAPKTRMSSATSTRPIADAEKPRSWPRIGTAKACTSQHIDNSQLMASSRLQPGYGPPSSTMSSGRSTLSGRGSRCALR